MNRRDAMLERLPAPYAIEEGTRLHDLLGVVALQQQVFDEDMDRVQRSHWVDHAFAIDDLARLGALFQLAPARWEPRTVFRTRLKATVGAILGGSVTREQLDRALARVVDSAQQVLATRYLDTGPLRPGGPPVLPFVENPDRRRRAVALAAEGGHLRPHDRFVIANQGVEPTVLSFAMTGVPGDRTAMPLLVNHTTGAAIGFRGVVPAGRQLVVTADGDGGLVADLDGDDVTARVFSTRSYTPGPGRPELVADDEPRLLPLGLGDNECQLASLARYDEPGTDAAALAMPVPDLHQGRFDDGAWGAAVFHQEPVATLDAWWTERTPAAFRFELPAGTVRRTPRVGRDPEVDRAELVDLLQSIVDSLKAAAVHGEVRATRLRDHQRAGDRLTVLAPVATTEQGSAGEDRLAGTSAQFDETPRDLGRFE